MLTIVVIDAVRARAFGRRARVYVLATPAEEIPLERIGRQRVALPTPASDTGPR